MAGPEGNATGRFSRERLPDLALGIAAILLGLYVGYDATGYRDGSTYDSLGPSLMPMAIAAGLIVSGLAIAKNALNASLPFHALDAMDWQPVALLAAAVAIPILCLTTFGWVLTIPFVFALSSRAFGSRRVLLDLAIGFGFSAATFAIFNYGLGLSLPVGTLVAGVIG